MGVVNGGRRLAASLVLAVAATIGSAAPAATAAPVQAAAKAERAADDCTIVGTRGPDVLRGTAGPDVICALSGDDELIGLGGRDVLRGGGGADELRGGLGDDTLAGGAGGDELDGGAGNDQLGGFRGNDRLLAVDGADYRDVLRCGPGVDSGAADPPDVVRGDCENVEQDPQNQLPSDIALNPSSVEEHQPAGTLVGQLSATDPDATDTHSFTFVAGTGSADNGLFTMSGTQLRTAAVLDFEAGSTRSIRVRVTDSEGGQFEKQLTVTVTDDVEPTAVDDTETVDEDSVATAIDVLANDTDTDGGPIRIASVTQPANGTVAIINSGADVTYQPAADYCNDPPGTNVDTFTYTLTPGGDTGAVDVTVTCVDDNPVAHDDSATLGEDDPATAIPVLANDSDIDGDPLTINAATQPANGTVELTGGSPGAHTVLTYQPNPNYCNDPGAAPTDNFTYTLSGGNTATVAVTVTCVDDPVSLDNSAGATTYAEDAAPVVVDGTVTITNPDGLAITGATVSITGNYAATQDVLDWTDNDNTDSITEDTGSSTAQTVVLSGTGTANQWEAALEAITYVNGSQNPTTVDRTVTFTISTGSGPASDTKTVQVSSDNDAPVANDDSATVAEDSGASAIDVLANDTDAEGDPVSITTAADPAHGIVVLTGGSPGAHTGLTYQPDPNYCNDSPGSAFDTFAYTLNGGDEATVSMKVTCVAEAPTVDTSPGATSFTEGDGPAVVDSGVTIADPDGLNITGGSVSITTNAAAGDVLDWTDNSTGDSIVEGASTSGTVVLTGNGTAAQYQAALRAVTYDNSSDDPSTLARAVTFEITSSAGTASDTKTVQVIAVDDPPVAVDDSATVLEDALATAIPVLTNDTDVDAGPKTISSASDPANGTVVLTGGSPGAHTELTYQPDPHYCNNPPGTTADTFTYTLNGGDTATVSMTVTCVNDAPVADDETFNGANAAIGNTSLVVDDPTDGAPDPAGPQKTVTGDILAGDTDVDGPGPMTVTPGTFTTNDGGSVTIQADGDFTYTSDPVDACTDASDFFDYTVEDSGDPEQTDTGRVTIAVTECVWYVDATAAPGGDGQSDAPYNALTSLNGAGGVGDADGVDDYLFLYGGGTFSTGLVLEGNQRLLGQPHGLTVAGTALVASGGTNPNIHNPSGNGLQLANGVEVQRVNVGVTGAGSNIGIHGFGVTNATIGSNILVEGNSVGVNLQGPAAGTINVGATINGGTGDPVAVQNRSGGSVTFTGNVTSNSLNSAVELLNNTGATITFTGVLNIDGTATSPVAAFAATGGGTVVANNPANDISGFTGVGVNLNGVAIGAGGIVFNNVSSSGVGATNGILLTNVTGTGSLTVNGGTLTTSTRGVDIDGGGVDVTVNATLNPTGGRSVEVTNRTGGLVDLNGAVNEDATGVNLTGNAGTIRFDGGIVASTTTNTALNAVGNPGSLVVTDPAGLPVNTLTTTTGTALNVTNTTIGADDLTFQSIASNGAANGIVLNTTGSTGGLTVTGTGAAPSGGTINNSTGAGVLLTNVGGGVSFDGVNITNGGDDGIRATTVTGLSITDSTVTNNGNSHAGGAEERGLDYLNVTGATQIVRTTVSGSDESNAHVENTNAGTTTLTVTNSTFSGSKFNAGLRVKGGGTSVVNATVTGSTFSGNFDPGFAMPSDGSAQQTLVFDNNDVSGGHASAVPGRPQISLNSGGSAQVKATISDNDVKSAAGSEIILNTLASATPSATFDAMVVGNDIGDAQPGSLDPGSDGGSGIHGWAHGDGTTRIEIRNNTVQNWGVRALELSHNDGNGTADFTVANNSLSNPDSSVNTYEGVYLFSGGASGDTSDVCIDLKPGNDMDGIGQNAISDIGLDRFTGASLRFAGFNDTSVPNLQSFLRANNAPSPNLTVETFSFAPTATTATSCAAAQGTPANP